MPQIYKTIYRYGKLVETEEGVTLEYATRPFHYNNKKVNISDTNVSGWLKYGWKEIIKAEYPEYDYEHEYVTEEYSEDAEKIYVNYIVVPYEG